MENGLLTNMTEEKFEAIKEKIKEEDKVVDDACVTAVSVLNEEDIEKTLNKLDVEIREDVVYEYDMIKYLLNTNNFTEDNIECVACNGKYYLWEDITPILKSAVVEEVCHINDSPNIDTDLTVYGKNFIITRSDDIMQYNDKLIQLNWFIILIPDHSKKIDKKSCDQILDEIVPEKSKNFFLPLINQELRNNKNERN